ncbi:mitochondrial escape protein 2 [Phlyctochytrium bullatum]|nr:mitochondrial escape protein 2 [Phlyctochytrium bullatum]
MGRFDPRHYWIKQYANSLRKEAKNSIVPKADAFPGTFTYKSSIANVKEGGVILNFSYEGGSLEEAFEVVRKHIDERGLRSSFNFQKITPYLVSGTPFVEDIQSSVPTNRIRVEFSGPPVTPQALFAEFRRFGKIEDISLVPTPFGKDTKIIGHVQFTRIRSATAARTCLQGTKIGDSLLVLDYEPPLLRNYIYKFAKDHPRLSIPIILALLAGLSFVIFDPLRIFFITNEVTHRFSFQDYVMDQLQALLAYVKEYIYGGRIVKKNTMDEAFSELELEKMRLSAIVKETPQTFVLVNGPDGSGKTYLVNKALEHTSYKLRIDCSALVTQRDHIALQNLAKQVGYFPIFTWFVSAGSFIDTMITAATGAKAGIASTNEEQIKRILELVTISLNRITSKQRVERQRAIAETKEAQYIHGADSVLPQTNGKREEAVAPEVDFPVIVIDEFLSKEKGRNAYIYDLLSEWATVLVDNQIAHVIFISNNSGAQKRLGKANPRRAIETISLTDAKFESAQAYVRRRLGVVYSTPELDRCIEAIGGRLTDLELLVQKIQATSQSPSNLSFTDVVSRSFNDLVGRTVNEIRKVGLQEEASSTAENSGQWSAVQFWKLVELLSKFDEVAYDDLRFHPLFKGEDASLQALERSGLISVGMLNGRPFTIKAGKPLYKVAFSQLISDKKLAAIMGVQTVRTLTKSEEAKISKIEAEILSLGKFLASSRDSLSRASRREIQLRVDFLLKQLGESQRKISVWDTEEVGFKKSLKLVE